MKRRSLLALLGVGSLGGAGLFVAGDISLPGSGGDSDSQQGTPTATPNAEDTSTDWGSQLQSRLHSQPVYGDVSFATESATATITDEEFVDEIRVDPADTEGDLFRFSVPDAAEITTVEQLTEGLVRPDGDISVEATLDGMSVTFTGGPATVGDFVSAMAQHPTERELLLARGASEDELTTVIESITN